VNADPPRLAALAAVVAIAAACGKIGPPQPPLRPVPVAVSDLTAERIIGSVTLRFTVPNATVETTTPPRVDGVEVYAMSQPAAAPAPSAAQLAVPAYRVATIVVKRPNDKPVDKDPRPDPGDPASFVEDPPVPAASTIVRYYAVAGISGNRRGPVSPVLAVPMTPPPFPPADIKDNVTEQTLRLSWSAGTKDARYFVERPGQGTDAPVRLTPEPLSTPEFSLPVEFGKERCFLVRSASVTGPVTIAGAASAPYCVTPADKFPPAPPSALTPFASEGAVELTWTASTAADVAAYIVLRGEGAGDTLQRLTTSPVAGTQYRDQTVKAGTTYTYAVIAVDKSGNESQPSERQSVTARRP
jgi:hypothetical protein